MTGIPSTFSVIFSTLQEDSLSADMLEAHDRNVLINFSPRQIIGDGNCFYRAVSLALFGSQQFHFYVRAATAFHIIEDPSYYDISSASYVMNDMPIITPCIRTVINIALTDGDYAELVHIFAASAALCVPIQSYCTPGTHNIAGIHPYSVRVENNNYDIRPTEACNEVRWHCNGISVLTTDDQLYAALF